MTIHVLERQQWVPRPPDEVFPFFAEAANLERLTPPWMRFEMLTPPPIEMTVGTHIQYRVHWWFLPIRWLTEIVEWSPPTRFVDVQLRGPYKLWHHTHTFEPVDGGTLIRDTVRYALPLGPLGQAAHRLAVRQDLKAIFDYRARRVSRFLASPPSVVTTHCFGDDT
jgi:ligand-binding SRPBCC domain-containing protein